MSGRKLHPQFTPGGSSINSNPYAHNSAFSDDSSNAQIPLGSQRYDSYSNLESGNARTGGAYMTQRDRDTASTGAHVFIIVALLALIGLGIATLVVTAHGNDQHTCHQGEQCHRFGLIDNTGVCNEDGVCVGDSRGQCDAVIDFLPDDCRPLVYGYTVDTYDYLNVSLCWNGLCVYVLEAGLSHDWICPGGAPGGQRYELKEVGQKRCRDYVFNDPDYTALEAMATCIGGDPVCVYTYRDAGYTKIRPAEPPYILNADGEVVGVEPVEPDYLGHLEQAYQDAKAAKLAA